ncbi:aspartate aminotransferase family protein [Rhodococcus sp. NPDC059968]|uniref:class-III pyridoxal-phosphate-dependent aminotransferase n=1 Tax=Rhodococcus sp. NPDC059968 TaxID=3347017 RepID=UPI00366F3ADD
MTNAQHRPGTSNTEGTDAEYLRRFGFSSKQDVVAKSISHWNPDKTRFWIDAGVPLIIGRRHGYFMFDIDGHRLIDVSLNGGIYNLGHRNPEIIAAVVDGLEYFDIGSHQFPSVARTALAEALIDATEMAVSKVAFGSGGGEAVDIALKSARHATGRRKVVSIRNAYHGHTGLAVATGDPRYSQMFLADRPDEFVQVPFNDINAMRTTLEREDVAAVILETIPATYGFPLPDPGYLPAVKSLCEQFGSLYIADEVQTGMMRTGRLWAISGYGVTPDIIVSAKGFSGGIYPISAVLLNQKTSAWLDENGFGHISTFGGAEIGCIAALKTLEITTRTSTRESVVQLAEAMTAGLVAIQDRYSDWLLEVRQNGLVIGLKFAQPNGAKIVMKHMYAAGVYAKFAALDPSVLQFKPGLLLDEDLTNELLTLTEAAVGQAWSEVQRA